MTINLDHLRDLLRPDGVEVKPDSNRFVLEEKKVMACTLVSDPDHTLAFKLDHSAPHYLSENVVGLNGVSGLNLRKCCDYGVLVKHEGQWCFLLVELQRTLQVLDSEVRKKVEQLVLGTPALMNLASIARLYTDTRFHEVSYMYFILYDQVKIPWKTEGNGKHNSSKRTVVEPGPRYLLQGKPQLNSRCFRYGRPGKHIHILGRQINSVRTFETGGLIKEYLEQFKDRVGK